MSRLVDHVDGLALLLCVFNIDRTSLYPSAWEGSSVWDLPIEPVSQTSVEQIQLEKLKAAKVR